MSFTGTNKIFESFNFVAPGPNIGWMDIGTIDFRIFDNDRMVSFFIDAISNSVDLGFIKEAHSRIIEGAVITGTDMIT
jgi:hypothetical protein